MESGRAEGVLGLGSAVAHAEEDECHPAGVAAGAGQGRLGEAGVDPGVVLLLEGRGEAPHVAPVDRGHVPADGQDRLPVGGRQVELDEAPEAAGEGGTATVTLTQPEAPRRLGQVEGEALRGPVEPASDVPEQQEGGGA